MTGRSATARASDATRQRADGAALLRCDVASAFDCGPARRRPYPCDLVQSPNEQLLAIARQRPSWDGWRSLCELANTPAALRSIDAWLEPLQDALASWPVHVRRWPLEWATKKTAHPASVIARSLYLSDPTETQWSKLVAHLRGLDAKSFPPLERFELCSPISKVRAAVRPETAEALWSALAPASLEHIELSLHPWTESVLVALASSPTLSTVRSLSVERTESASIARCLRSPHAASLRELSVGDNVHLCDAFLDALGDGHSARVERLSLGSFAASWQHRRVLPVWLRVAEMDWPRLRSLSTAHGTVHTFSTLLARSPALETATVQLVDAAEDAALRGDSLRAALALSHASVRSLRLFGESLGDSLWAALLSSPLVRGVRALDVIASDLGQESGRAVAKLGGLIALSVDRVRDRDDITAFWASIGAAHFGSLTHLANVCAPVELVEHVLGQMSFDALTDVKITVTDFTDATLARIEAIPRLRGRALSLWSDDWSGLTYEQWSEKKRAVEARLRERPPHE